MGIWMTVVHIKWVYFKENILALHGAKLHFSVEGHLATNSLGLVAKGFF